MRPALPLQPPHLRRANRTSILLFVREQGPVTRPQVADATGLSRPTVTKLVEELLAEGLLRESGLGHSTSSGGKRPGLVELNTEAVAVAAVAIGIESVEAGIVDLGGHILLRRTIPMAAGNPTEMIERIGELADGLVREFSTQASRPVIGLGVGAPGVVHPATGVTGYSPNLPGWREVPLGGMLAQATGLPVALENRCRAQTLGEVWFGHGRHTANLVGLEAGVHIEGAVILDGKLYRGLDDSALEMGHTTVDPAGAQCSCGNMGCWEVYASRQALLGLIRDALWRGEPSILRGPVGNDLEALGLPAVIAALRAGDPLAHRYAVAEMGYRLGIGLANVINIFNPELVVLFGAMTDTGEDLLVRIRSTVTARALQGPGRRVRILASALGSDAPLVGAATLVISPQFSNDLVAAD